MEYLNGLWLQFWNWLPAQTYDGKVSVILAFAAPVFFGLVGLLWRRLRGRTQVAVAPASAEEIARQVWANAPHAPGNDLQQQLQAKEQEIAALTRTVQDLQAGAKADQPGMEEALAALQRGETDKAVALFDRIAEEKAAAGASANEEAARALRNKGNLLFLHDTHAAMAAYAKATELDPDDPEGWNRLGLLQLRTGALDAAITSFERVLSIGNKLADKTWEAAATGNLGIIYAQRGEIDRAEAMFLKGLEIDKELGRKEGMAAKTGNLGLIYSRRGELDRAEAMFLKGLEIDEELGRKEGIAAKTGNLGLIYKTRGELDRAEAMHLRSLEIEKALGRKEGMAADYGNLGLIYQTRGELDRAEAMQKRSLELNEELGRKEGMAAATGNLGLIYRRRGELDRAEAMYLKAMELDNELGSKEGVAINSGNLGNVYQQKGDAARACAHWRTARDLFREIGSPTAAQVEGWMRDAGCPDA